MPYTEGMDLSRLANRAIEELQTANGLADYVLVVNGKLIGMVEAKKMEVDFQNVLEQPKRHLNRANKAVGQWSEYNIPFLYSINRNLI